MTMAKYNNSQVAHVWAAQSKQSGESHNGNFYFSGRILYSYGSHFPVGVIMGVNDVVLNADSYSVSTSGMQSDARNAVSHMTRIHAPNLKAAADNLATAARHLNAGTKAPDYVAKQLLDYIADNAAALSGDAGGPWINGRFDDATGEYIQGYSEPSGRTQAEALGAMAGLPAVRVKAALKRGLAAAEKAAKAKASDQAKREKAEAISVADMTANERDSWLSKRFYFSGFDGGRGDDITADNLRRASKALFRLIKTAKASGLSTSRLGRLKGHRAAVLALLKAYDTDAEGLVAGIRAERFANWLARYDAAKDDAARLAVWRSNGVKASEYAENSQERGLLELAHLEGVRLDSAERMAQEREAREAWLKGEGSNRVRLSGPNGSALVRRSNDGTLLETSHGASVPWEHAVKAFRFIRHVVKTGEEFRTNGRVVRVGHFKVDSIDRFGNMRAGCHSFEWSVMKELAEQQGVWALEPSTEAVEVTH